VCGAFDARSTSGTRDGAEITYDLVRPTGVTAQQLKAVAEIVRTSLTVRGEARDISFGGEPAMDPSEVESSEDVREGWDDWSYNERIAALDALANATLDQYGYDGVDVDTGDTEGYAGQYSDGEVELDPGVIEDPDPEHAIHVTNHETVHAMNDQDGIDDYNYEEGDDFEFDEDDLESFEEHGKVGGVADQLDEDGFGPWADASDSGAGGGGGGGGGGGSGAGESAGEPNDPKAEDLEFEIDWSQGVWIDTPTESGMSVDILYSAPEGW